VLTTIVIGLVDGVIFGLVALGIVLIYKGSRVFNFAQAEFATVSMFVLYLFVEAWSIPYVFAALLAIMAATGMALLTERLVVRPLASAPKVLALVGTAGVSLLAIGIQLIIAKPEPRSVSRAIEGGDIQVFGFFVSGQQILALVALAAVAAGAIVFFQRTFLGMAILANSMDSMAARIVGANANRISALTWGIAGFTGGLAGVLLAPEVTLVPGYMTSNILIPAFTAAVVGGMTSLLGAFVAGAGIGVLGAVADNVHALEAIPEASVVVLFVVLVVTLAIRPQGIFGSEA
jgi:branched-chain amino acid transport system permease protein